MVDVLHDRFLVFIRDDAHAGEQPDTAEEVVAACASHEEAQQVQRIYEVAGRHCIIRFDGASGGGD